MLLLKLWNYTRGYIIILVEGLFLEKFINICAHRQIFLWDIKKHKNGILTLKVSIKGFKLLRPVARKSRCRVRILKKKGLPFVLNRYRRRKAFVAGAALFIILTYILTSFVWAIELTGNKELDSRFILEKLENFGIKPGVLKYKIDTDKAVNNMIMEIDRLAWISISLKGTKVKVDLAERELPPKLIPKDEPCNIVAKRDGVIKTITAKSGIEMVKVGDTVKKGQLLVSGSIAKKNEEGEARLVHAIASVKARTWYERRERVNQIVVEKVRTGRTKNIYSFVIFTKRLNLFKKYIKFENYDKIEINKKIAIGEDLVLPFEIIVEKYFENILQEKELDIDEAKQIAADKAYTEALKDISDTENIVQSSVNFIQDENKGLTAVVTIECIEDIGVEEKIGGN
jgi:similar to stage IV sporulation protein